jgi:sortase A
LLKWVGIACLVLASGLAGYIGWILYGTGLETRQHQEALAPDLQRVIGTKTPQQASADPVLPGGAYAFIDIPRIDLDHMVVVEGTGEEQLKEGPGHYSDTADPWDEGGRVGIAGHRTTYLAPFGNLDKMQDGDAITLETEAGTFRYRVTDVFVVPTEGSGVVLAQTVQPTLVLTTCNPKYSATERLIVTADRV